MHPRIQQARALLEDLPQIGRHSGICWNR
jgi:hypothetical protein